MGRGGGGEGGGCAGSCITTNRPSSCEEKAASIATSQAAGKARARPASSRQGSAVWARGISCGSSSSSSSWLAFASSVGTRFMDKYRIIETISQVARALTTSRC